MEVNVMTQEETERLVELEAVIRKDLKGFVRVGLALKEIKDQKLYRGKYTTWKEYLKVEWDISRAYGDRYIEASDVIENLRVSFEESAPIGALSDEEFEYTVDFSLPQNEAQTRPLTLLSKDQQAPAWKRALFVTGGRVTALAVSKVVEEILEIQLEDKKGGLQTNVIKEVTVPDDFSEQFAKLIEVLAMYRKAGWRDFNRKKALEFVDSIKEYLNS